MNTFVVISNFHFNRYIKIGARKSDVHYLSALLELKYYSMMFIDKYKLIRDHVS